MFIDVPGLQDAIESAVVQEYHYHLNITGAF